jgi:hypothetical protein
MSNVADEDTQYPNQVLGDDFYNDANAGTVNNFAAPLRLATNAGAAGCILNSGANAPTIGGNVGDLYFRTNPSGANTLIYQCTTAGAAGAAVWTGKV